MFPKYRGKQVLMRDENGLEKCVACGLCSVACPADAIYLEAAENDGTRPGRSALRVGLPDSQDALHLLRLLRRGLPGRRDLHGQGLRAGGLQQGRLRLGQDGPARAGVVGDGAGAADDSPQSRPPMQIGALGDIHGAFDAVSEIMTRHPDVPLWVSVGDVASNDGEYFTPLAPALLDQGQQRGLRRDRRGARGPSAGADAALPAQRRPSSGRPVARRRARRHLRAELVPHAGRGAAAVEGPQGVGGVAEAREEPRRQAAALRARRGARVQGAARTSTCS